MVHASSLSLPGALTNFTRPWRRCAATALLALATLATLPAAAPDPLAEARAGAPLPLWSDGCLDIHHINTGKGECSFFILPDGTTMLIDAGAAPTTAPWGVDAKPNARRAPGAWIARYIDHMLARFAERRVDYFVLTHFHWDHMGAISADSPVSANGAYLLGGLTEVAEHIRFMKVIDRNWPDYNWPVPLDDEKMKNYRKFLAWQSAHRGLRAEQFQVGRNDQLGLVRHPGKFANFEIRNLAANGRVWTGVGTNARNHFPALETLAKEDYPEENKCSIAIRISYGKFDYFSGGDLDARELESSPAPEPWKDIERPVALVTGPVEACKANHHANYDANSAFFLSVLQPQVILVSTWGASQPSMNVYRRFLSSATYPGPREVFLTNVMNATKAALHVDQLKNETGHLVLRVRPGGAEFFVYVLDDSNEEYRIKSVSGPYRCR